MSSGSSMLATILNFAATANAGLDSWPEDAPLPQRFNEFA